MKGKSLTQGMPWKQILLFAAPVFLGLLLQQLYNTVDTIIVGNYAGETALSAVGTTTCLVTFFLALANGFSAGAGVVAAQLFGAGQEEELKQLIMRENLKRLEFQISTRIFLQIFARQSR